MLLTWLIKNPTVHHTHPVQRHYKTTSNKHTVWRESGEELTRMTQQEEQYCGLKLKGRLNQTGFLAEQILTKSPSANKEGTLKDSNIDKTEGLEFWWQEKNWLYKPGR